MKILVVAYNIFKNVGGGETVYSRIISSLKDVNFTYLSNDVGAEIGYPPNATPVQVEHKKNIYVENDPGFPMYMMEQLKEADAIARSVAGQSFDIVDIPDYFTCGAYLRSAFAFHKVSVKRIVLAMHGNISTSIGLNWDTKDTDVSDIEANETMQFRYADYVYSISKSYIDEWQKRVPREIEYIDPMNFVNYSVSKEKNIQRGGVTLACIGRSERRKGNDIFLDMNRWISTQSVKKGIQIGGIYKFQNGVGSDYHLQNLAGHRSINVEYLYSMSRTQLNSLFSERIIVVLPVRYDTLNLVALEALFSGCPVAVSTKAGVCRYLDETFPSVPYIKIDFDDYGKAILEIEELAERYDDYRNELVEAISNIDIHIDIARDMLGVYRNALDNPKNTNQFMVNYKYKPINLKSIIWMTCRITRTERIAIRLKNFNIKDKIQQRLRASKGKTELKWIGAIRSSRKVPKAYLNISAMPENRNALTISKIHAVEELIKCPFYHCYAYKELCRLLNKIGENDLEATYALRTMRLSGVDLYSQCENTYNLLNLSGRSTQADVVKLLYGEEGNPEEVYKYLCNSYENWIVNPTTDECDIMRDFREGNIPKVSIIVSLYNAADKLEFFLSMISKQTLLKKGLVEIIFIDSASPSEEYDILKEYSTKMNFLYLRSKKRETIQKAWNRAIPYARAEYITFLGVDEMLYPDALEILSDELDKSSNVDWVVGNSLIESVEMNGTLNNDTMIYNRQGGFRFSAYFETCYLTYVGGLYRKSIHEKYGYYNETYKGAGDTEFKNRILKYINVKYIDRTLGIFLDYPQERVTASCMAEIEDLSAWYVYRSQGGVRYQYELASIEEIEQALKWALSYRKSYKQENGCDIEYANHIIHYLLERDPSNQLANMLRPGIETVLKAIQELDSATPSLRGRRQIRRFRKIKNIISRISKEHREITAIEQLEYTFDGDNRFQQHRWIWPLKESLYAEEKEK